MVSAKPDMSSSTYDSGRLVTLVYPRVSLHRALTSSLVYHYRAVFPHIDLGYQVQPLFGSIKLIGRPDLRGLVY